MGSLNKRTQNLIAAAEAAGVMPLPTILGIMRYHVREAEGLMRAKKPRNDLIRDALDRARIAARDAAPYLHATLKARVDIPLGDAAKMTEFASAKAALLNLVDRVAITIEGKAEPAKVTKADTLSAEPKT